MRVLVTGAAGFIGSHVVEILVSKGYEVIGVDDLSTGSLDNVEHLASSFKLIVDDITSPSRVTNYLREVDAVIHLAAIASVDECRDNPCRATLVNVYGTVSMLHLALRLKAKHFIYASSAAVYGVPQRVPVSEDHPTNPLNVYGATKLAGELLSLATAREKGLRCCILRIFNAYGPRMRRGGYASVVYRFTRAILRSEPMIIQGDGSQTRDFIYVKDVARAFLAALEARAEGVYNIGSGIEVSIRELADLVNSVAKSLGLKPVGIVYASPRPSDTPRSCASIDKAVRELGWKPQVRLADGLRETLKWALERVLMY